MTEKGRRGVPDVFRDTIARGSSEQAILVKMDIVLEALRQVRDAADLAAAQTALDALDLTDIILK